MAYTGRTSDAYSRRPTDDRRRDLMPSEDERRRSISAAAQLLQRKVSTSSLPGVERGGASETPMGLFKNYADAVSDWAWLKSEKDTLDKVLKQRKAEYERSMAKHAELFPSVPELQNMHLKKHLDHRASLDAQIHKAQRRVDSLAESLERIIADKPRAPTVGPSQPDVDRIQAEIAALRSTLEKIESDRARERKKSELESNRRLEEMKQAMRLEMKQQLEDAVKDIQKDMSEKIAKAVNASKDETHGGVKRIEDQLLTMRAGFHKFQEEFQQSQDDTRVKLAKQQKDLEAAKSGLSKTEITALLQTETSPLKSSISGLTTNISELSSLVNALSGERASDAKDIARLRNRLAEADRKMEEHEIKLSSLDMEALDLAAEMSIGFPELLRKVDSLQSKVGAAPGDVDEKVFKVQSRLDAIPGEIDKKQEELFGKVQAYVGKVGSLLGAQVDEVRKDVTGTKKRVEALETSSAAKPSLRCGGDASSLSTQDHATTPGSESAPSDAMAAVIKTNVEAFNAAIEALRNENARLSERISKLMYDQQELQGLASRSQGLAAEVDTVRHSVLVLSARFDNLSTRGLAEHMIAYLRHLYPESDQLVADIKLLKEQLDQVGARVGSVETELRDFKDGIDGLDGGPGPFWSGNGVAGREHSENWMQAGAKRKRLDSLTGGPARPVVGGFR
ncbi:hypothetical protein VTJ83DRAFT_6665 [Remersonia thermophila]|uniref:Paramyosin n=1 Tax=Remersonia thermophila TaxID=72144 RepID=A0ABR4D5G0_9PEZI